MLSGRRFRSSSSSCQPCPSLGCPSALCPHLCLPAVPAAHLHRGAVVLTQATPPQSFREPPWQTGRHPPSHGVFAGVITPGSRKSKFVLIHSPFLLLVLGSSSLGMDPEPPPGPCWPNPAGNPDQSQPGASLGCAGICPCDWFGVRRGAGEILGGRPQVGKSLQGSSSRKGCLVSAKGAKVTTAGPRGKVRPSALSARVPPP